VIAAALCMTVCWLAMPFALFRLSLMT